MKELQELQKNVDEENKDGYAPQSFWKLSSKKVTYALSFKPAKNAQLGTGAYLKAGDVIIVQSVMDKTCAAAGRYTVQDAYVDNKLDKGVLTLLSAADGGKKRWALNKRLQGHASPRQ